MSNKARNTSGKFATKSETPRKIRSVNLTDDAWQWLADVAAQSGGVSRNDYLEAMAEGSIPLMETAISKTSPLMETVESDDAKITEQPDSEVSPLMEMAKPETESLRQELDQAKADYDALLDSSTEANRKLTEDVRGLLAKLNREELDREEVERELSDLKQKSATAREFPEAADLLNQLKAKRKKSKIDLADIEAILEILED